jgi:hypothetical protein
MDRMRWMLPVTLALTGLLVACSGTDPQDERASATGDGEATGVAAADDPLEGTWIAVLTPELEHQAALAAGLEPNTMSHEEMFYGKGPVTVVLTFEDGQMIHTTAPEGVEPEVGWSGLYEIVDDDTVVAGDTGDLYIEYTYSIDGDQLVIDMVRDDYPTVSEEELAGEIYAQTVIYESVPFTREA